MKHFRWFLLSIAILGVFALVLFGSTFPPKVNSFTSFTPPGRVVLASFPAPVTPRGEETKSQAATITQSTTPTVTPQTSTAVKPTAAPKTTPTKASVPPAPTCAGAFTQQFLCLLNQYRVSKGLAKLSFDSSLATVALKHSQWMNSTGTFSHEETDGSHLLDRCQAAGIICRGENLAKGATSAQNLLDMWKASSSHNANLIGSYKTMGLGISGGYITLLLN